MSTALMRTLTNSGERLSRLPAFGRAVMLCGSSTALNVVLLFGETVLAARLLDTQSYGIYTLLVAVANLLVVVTDCGYKTTITQQLAGSQGTRTMALAHSALAFRLGLLVLVTPLMLFGRNLIAVADPTREILRFAALVPLMVASTSIDELLLAMLQGLQMYRAMATAKALRSVLRLGLSAAFMLATDLGAAGLVWSWVLSFTASILYELAHLPLRGRLACRIAVIRESLQLGLPIYLDRLLWYASSQADVLLIGALAGPTDAAYYTIALRIPSALHRLFESYVDVYFPTMSALLAQGQRQRAHQVLGQSVRLLSFLGAGLALGAAVYSRPIMTLLFSSQYLPSSPVFAVLMLALHMTLLVNLLGYTLTAAGFAGHSLLSNSVRTAILVLASVRWIPSLGAMGPAYASLLAYSVAAPLSSWMLHRHKVPAAAMEQITQLVVLWLCLGVYLWWQPASLVARALVIVTFIALSTPLVLPWGERWQAALKSHRS